MNGKIAGFDYFCVVKNLLSAFLISFALFALAACGPKQDPDETVSADTVVVKVPEKYPAKPGLVYPVELKKGAKNAYMGFTARSGDTLYFSTYKGRVEYSDTLGANRHFIFDLKTEFLIDRIFVTAYGANQFFVVWQETNHLGVKSCMALFNTGEEKPVWKQTFSVINAGQPVVDGEHAYITTLGMVGKIGINDGVFVWKKDSLFSSTNLRYQKFETPIVTKDRVLFVDYPIPGKRTKRDTIMVDVVSGERVR